MTGSPRDATEDRRCKYARGGRRHKELHIDVAIGAIVLACQIDYSNRMAWRKFRALRVVSY
jgi:hypothetical protein